MKKTFLTIALMGMLASSASALSFNWGASSISFDGTVLKKSEAVTGYLIYLSSGSYSTTTLTDTSTGESIAKGIGGTLVSTSSTATSNAGKLTTKFSFDYGTYGNDDVFGMVLVYNDGTDNYYNMSSSTYTLAGIADETSSPDAANFTFSFSNSDKDGTLSSGGGWTAVPEPSTAALALAGLALLLKRRKA